MYKPSYRTQKNGVPVLKKEEIDAIGEAYVQDFQPGVLRNPAPVEFHPTGTQSEPGVVSWYGAKA